MLDTSQFLQSPIWRENHKPLALAKIYGKWVMITDTGSAKDTLQMSLQHLLGFLSTHRQMGNLSSEKKDLWSQFTVR